MHEKYNYQLEVRKLVHKKFQDSIEAKITLAKFKNLASANGYRGQASHLTTKGNRVVFK